jgi:hypothetical protein
MSFVITMYTRDGIVMASDSRLTLNTEQKKGENQLVQVAVGVSDNTYYLFLLPNGIGLASYGAAEVNGTPVALHIETFVETRLAEESLDIDEIPQALLGYFRQFDPPPALKFHVAGYKARSSDDDDDVPPEFREYFRQMDAHSTGTLSDADGGQGATPAAHSLREQRVWQVDVGQNNIGLMNASRQLGVSWGGEGDILARLIQPVAIIDPKSGDIRQKLPVFSVPWQFFTLQDAIDFCVFAVRTTIEIIRFQARPKTVGGPVDVLVIKPDEAFWVQRKDLHSPDSPWW